jgi:quinol monooxygenase YgiN
VVFAVDSSRNVKKSEFDQQKAFVKNIARSLNVEPGKSRAALVTYGNNPKRVFIFEGYDSRAQFESKVDGASPQGGYRRIDKVLEEASEIFNSSRQGASRVLVLLTAGGQYPAFDAIKLSIASQPLRDQGTKMYVIHVGNQPRGKEIDTIVNRPEDVIPVKTFDTLSFLGSSIGREIAMGAGEYSIIITVQLMMTMMMMMRGSYIAHFTNVSMRFTTSEGLFRCAYYGALAAEQLTIMRN